ncbi:MAG: PEP-CTERM sorting domain-containing protein [Pseudomonadota bacterium]
MKLISAVAAALALVLSAPANASLFNASYTTETGGMVTFMFDGTVEADMDTVIVNSLLMPPTFNGVAPAAGAVSGFLSFTDANNGAAVGDPVVFPAVVSFSGTSMDFVYYNDSPNDAFVLADAFVTGLGFGGYVGGPSWGNGGFEIFNFGNWSLTPKAVPTPNTVLLLGLGMIGVSVLRKRQTISS